MRQRICSYRNKNGVHSLSSKLAGCSKSNQSTRGGLIAFAYPPRESKGAGVNDVSVTRQSRDLARPQARIPVRVTIERESRSPCGCGILLYYQCLRGFRAHSTTPPFQLEPAPLGFKLASCRSTRGGLIAFAYPPRESKGAGVNDVSVTRQSRDMARPQARIPVRITPS